ncbi:MAG: endolytic transglycosylase MltG [Bacteroidales bacterium]|nr:endolytic transglycosylase MltG [Bacteroidales bacterium]
MLQELSRKYLLIGIAIVFAILMVIGYVFYNRMYRSNVRITEDKYLYIRTGSDFNVVVKLLQDNNIIADIESFIKTSERYNYTQRVKSGRYRIKSGMSNRDIVRMLISATQAPTKVTFNNIRTPEQLAGKVSHQIEADSLSILGLFRNPETFVKYDFKKESLISMFIPNTYEFYWNTSAEAFFDKMKRSYNQFWTDERKSKAKEINLTPIEVSTLASIVEEETIKQDERPKIAGVYINRLKKYMPLQADPTIKFALGDFTLRRIWTKHLEVKSPYNTYKNIGLPPGPINCPSISSINAVLNYENHQYLYFCAKDDFSGYHVFAKTLAEHNRNAEAYQRALNKERIFK